MTVDEMFQLAVKNRVGPRGFECSDLAKLARGVARLFARSGISRFMVRGLSDGRAVNISYGGSMHSLTADEARELGMSLLRAADEADERLWTTP